ncbi:Hypothetical Protein FCC1311_014842 [Hondaea fermentalgiana]|uniref:Uncharacterized protein n=1 Tax=Hondaea fermentalgiana TaxID=2315210 RepID=A0A2R5G2L3_9STRA|nr:Hypothetical Protein FCC1311_014842 [Hondaea fermentalgiana]|eukprot:GBG25267.1 Hypothetical Protein FCC1311_014842 [Hondaea fermentalgiana]
MPTRSTLFLLVVPILVLLSFIVRVERWFDAGGLEFGHVISSDTSSGLRGGKVALEDRDLVICSLVRDSARNIIQNLNVVEKVAKHFRSVKFIIVENDSTDGTDKLLQEWAATRGDYVELISMKIDDSLNIFLPGMPKHETNYDLSTRRFAKMALLRNIYLEKLTMMPQTSDPNAIVMIVDLDLHSIPASETVKSLRSTIAGERKMSPEWEAFCTNGITSVCIPDILGTEGCTFVRRDNGEFGRAYDGLAARFTDEEMKHSFVIQPGEEEPPDHVKNWYGHQIRGGLKLNDVNADPVPVKSCFGGIAVYKATKLKGLRYEGGDCEHLSVHRKLKNIYIIPDFNVYYD